MRKKLKNDRYHKKLKINLLCLYLNYQIMNLSNSIALFNWNWGIIGAGFMFLVFLGLIVALFLLMRTGKKKE